MYETFILENAQEHHAADPRHFLIPTQEELDAIGPDSLVQLVFVLPQESADGCRAERMWVHVTVREGDQLGGVLANEPHYIQEIKLGDPIAFEISNVAAVYHKDAAPAYDGELMCIITRKALEKGEINWVVRGDPVNEVDSGWQLFYGDEDEAYLDDANNAALFPLREMLRMEPLLDKVFSSSSTAFAFYPEMQDFIDSQTYESLGLAETEE